MTGEIGLQGAVKAVGGIREKIEGAKRAGIKDVIIPKENFEKSYFLNTDFISQML